MTCRSCGTANDPGRKFCSSCGSRLAVLCATCGTSNTAEDRFCGECGSPLVAGAAGAATSAEVPMTALQRADGTAERRIVTILFADLVGFTHLAEDRDPEVVRELLTRYFQVADEIVVRYGGTVEKFIGDAVMAVWGAPVAHEDDAERAVRAALDLVDGVRGLGFDGIPVDLRAGVLTGEAAVTVGAVGQGMVAGDLVNTASRLQSVATPGTVLVGQSTREATSGSIAYEAAGDHTLKGKASPVSAWRAVRVTGMVRGIGRSDVLEPPFTGRDAELRMIKEFTHAAGREHRFRLVSVTGQPGVGKSRLAWEFLKYIDGISEPIFWHQGRSPAYGQGITFWALGEMVRQRAGLSEDDDASTTRAAIAVAVAEYVSDEDERRWIAPRLLQLLGVEDGVGGDRDELFAAWRTFFERVSERGTVVLVFEDLQWADTGLLDFIDHLGEWSRGRPILVVTLARPDLLDRRPGWGAGRRDFVSLSLEPLARTEMRTILDGLAPGLPADLAEAVLARADGIPLYAVETVRMLLHGGQLEVVDGTYQPVVGTIRLDVPETLHALIAARLDALDSVDRVLLQDAAVLGQTFRAAALAAVADQDPATLDARLRALERREMITVELDAASPERGQYAFVQALIREVAYATLSRRDRRARHLAAARYFESLGDDEVGVLASHYRDAYLAVPEGEEGESVAVQARLALRGAAERAMKLHSYDQAFTFLEQALSISPENADDPDLLELTGVAAYEAGKTEEADRHLTHAIARRRSLGDRSGVARTTAQLGSTFLDGGRIDSAISLLEAAIADYPDLEAEPAMVSVAAQLARAYMIHEEPQAALVWVERALVNAERTDMVVEVADAMNTRALALQIVGRITESTITLRGILWLAERHGLTQAELRAYNNLSFMLATVDPPEALEVALSGLERARKVGSTTWAPLLASNAATAALRAGDWKVARSLIETWRRREHEQISDIELWGTQAIMDACAGLSAAERDLVPPAIDDMTDPQVPALLRFTDAWTALIAGRYDEAVDAALESATHATGYAVMAFAVGLRAALWAGDLGRATKTVAAFETLSMHGAAVEATRAVMRSGLAWLQGREDDARVETLAALDAWKTLGVRFEYALTTIDAVIASRGDRTWIDGPVAEARAILEDIGATVLLARLDEGIASAIDGTVADAPGTVVRRP